MRIADRFVVARPLPEVWALFRDVPAVTPCLPGAELTGDLGDGRYAGRMTVKLGPISAGFDGEASVILDEASSSAVIEGAGIDKRGGSRGRITVAYALTPQESGTAVAIDAEVILSGPVAQFGRTGILQEMSKRLIGQFVTCLEAKLGAATSEEAAAVRAPDVQAARLLLGSLAAQARRPLRRSGDHSEDP